LAALRAQARALEEEIRDIKRRLRKKQVYTVSRRLEKMRGRIYWMQQECTRFSPQAAVRWGNAVRMPDGRLAWSQWGVWG
jgi:hypothetical protein